MLEFTGWTESTDRVGSRTDDSETWTDDSESWTDISESISSADGSSLRDVSMTEEEDAPPTYEATTAMEDRRQPCTSLAEPATKEALLALLEDEMLEAMTEAKEVVKDSWSFWHEIENDFFVRKDAIVEYRCRGSSLPLFRQIWERIKIPYPSYLIYSETRHRERINRWLQRREKHIINKYVGGKRLILQGRMDEGRVRDLFAQIPVERVPEVKDHLVIDETGEIRQATVQKQRQTAGDQSKKGFILR